MDAKRSLSGYLISQANNDLHRLMGEVLDLRARVASLNRRKKRKYLEKASSRLTSGTYLARDRRHEVAR